MPRPETRAGKLAALLSRLRKDCFHDSHEVRETADALIMPRDGF